MEDSYKFLIVNGVVTVWQYMLLGEECNSMKDTDFIILREDFSRDIVGGISFNNQWGIGVKVEEDRCAGKCGF
jgi:hypothetical protein